MVEEWDGIVLALSWPTMLVANRWRGWRCTGAAGVKSSLRSPFIHLQRKFTKKDMKSAKFDGLVVYIDRRFCVNFDRHISVIIDRCKWLSSIDISIMSTYKNPLMQFDLHGTYKRLNRSVIPILSFYQHKSIDIGPKIPVLVHLLFNP